MDHIEPSNRRRVILIAGVFLFLLIATVIFAQTGNGKAALAAVQRFLLFYSGVFALIAMTATVGFGLAAADRMVMVPATRVMAQGIHRAISLAALAFLVIHIATEILANRAGPIDSVLPFLAPGRTFYIGLGTIASDLLVVLIATSIVRGRFASKKPATWRGIHNLAYLCWILSLVHGLVAGREGKPYVNWSYGVCVAMVLLALTLRFVTSMRDRREAAAHAVPGASAPAAAALPAAALAITGQLPVLPQASAQRLALPAGPGSSPAGQAQLPPAALQPLPPPDQHYGGDSYGEPYADEPYPGQYPGSHYPGYADDPYQGADYPASGYPGDGYPEYAEDPYGDPAYPGPGYPQGLWPEHPSWPRHNRQDFWPEHPSWPRHRTAGRPALPPGSDEGA